MDPVFYAFMSGAPSLPGRRLLPWETLMNPPRYRLYQRDHCPLCDQALAVLAAARLPEFETVWIDDDEALEARYGVRVPVLQDAVSGRELGWPFDVAAVREFLSAAAGVHAPECGD